MSRRANNAKGDEDNLLDNDIEACKGKTDSIYELMKLRELQSFITKIYWLVIMCFLAIGIVLAMVLSDGTFKDVFMAENILSSVGISAYVVLCALMILCNSHNEMRVILLLSILFFTGCLSGFMLALHLLDSTITLTKANHTL
tara:strand:+ start:2059 stop:2487 length:429 start_codon:yes stop_codon:yes gene_type:complete